MFNVGRAALLVAALVAGDLDALSTAVTDRLHQRRRLERSRRARGARRAPSRRRDRRLAERLGTHGRGVRHARPSRRGAGACPSDGRSRRLGSPWTAFGHIAGPFLTIWSGIRIEVNMSEQWGFETRQIHAGAEPDPATGARAVPIYQTTSYQFRDTEHAANLFALAEIGNIYTRIMNPTQGVLEARLSRPRGRHGDRRRHPRRAGGVIGPGGGDAGDPQPGEAGGHIVSSPSLYGGTYNLFHYTLPKMGIEVTFVEDPDDLDQWRAAIQPNTRRFFGETLANPRNDVLDIEGVAAVGPRGGRAAHRRQHHAHAVRDPPAQVGCRHRRALDDQVHRRPRHLDRRRDRRRRHVRLRRVGPVPRLHRARPSYHGLAYFPALGHGAYIIKARVQLLRDIGAAISPFNAFLFLQGIETLSACGWSATGATPTRSPSSSTDHPQVRVVAFAGLAGLAVARAAPPSSGGKGYGSVLAFEIEGGVDAGQGSPTH